MKSLIAPYNFLYRNGSIVILSTLFLTGIWSCSKKDFQDVLPEKSGAVSILAAALVDTELNHKIIYEENFEGSSFFSVYVSKQVGTTYGMKTIDSPVYSGLKSGRFELRGSDPLVASGTRAEVKFPQITDTDRWYSFAVYFPSANYKIDKSSEIITQWHQGGGTHPSISLMTKNNKMILDMGTEPEVRTQYQLLTLDKNKWHTYVLHIIHSHYDDGLLEMWQDTTKLLTLRGANSYDFDKFNIPVWKLGLYKWDWNDTDSTDTKKRVIYYDNIRLGSANATFADMADPNATNNFTGDLNTSLTINSFTLLNPNTEKDLLKIKDGDTFSLQELGVNQLNIRANANETVKSVRFELSGPQSIIYKDNTLPFSLMGDDGLGNYYHGIWYPPAVGNYTLTITPYSYNKFTGIGLYGMAGKESTIHFKITP